MDRKKHEQNDHEQIISQIVQEAKTFGELYYRLNEAFPEMFPGEAYYKRLTEEIDQLTS